MWNALVGNPAVTPGRVRVLTKAFLLESKMADDMRLDLNFVDHPKVKRLIRLAGYQGFYGLIRLFSMAGRIYTDGVFRGCTREDLEDFADWNGEGSLVDFLLEVKFLVENKGLFKINDWQEHQPWLAGAKDRSNKAKKAAKARWSQDDIEEEDSLDDDASSMLGACGEHSVSIEGAYAGSNAPSPSPSPSPLPSPSPIPYQSILDHYNNSCPSLPRATRLTDKRRGAINAVIKEFGEDAFKEALLKVERCPHLIGDNDRGWRADFDWLTNKNNLLKVIEGRYDQKRKLKEGDDGYYTNDVPW